MSKRSTEDIFLILFANFSAWSTVAANIVFFSYIIYKIIMIDLGYEPYFDRKLKTPLYNLFRSKFQGAPTQTPRRRFPSKKYRNGKKIRFFNAGTRFLCVLQLSTVGSVLADAYTALPVDKVPTFCYLQSIQMQIFNWFVFTWSSNVAFYMFYSIVFSKSAQNKHYLNIGLEIAAHCFALLNATVFTLIPLLTGTFGEAGGWCWIVDRAQQFGTFYGPLWVLIVVDIFIYAFVLVKVILSVRKTIGLKTSLKNEQQLKNTLRLILYPGIFLLVWTIPTLNRVLGIFEIRHIALSAFHIFITPLQGFLNVVVYFVNPIAHVRVLRFIFCLPCMMMRSTDSGAELDQKSDTWTKRLTMMMKDDFELDEGDSFSETDTLNSKTVGLMDHEYTQGQYTPFHDETAFDDGDHEENSTSDKEDTAFLKSNSKSWNDENEDQAADPEEYDGEIYLEEDIEEELQHAKHLQQQDNDNALPSDVVTDEGEKDQVMQAVNTPQHIDIVLNNDEEEEEDGTNSNADDPSA